MTWIGEHVDIMIAMALLLTVVITFMVAQTGLLPKKSLPFLAAGLAGFFGIAIFRSWRKSILLKELKEREKGLKEQEKRLDDMKGKLDVSYEDLNKVKAKANKQRAAYQKEVLLIDAKKKEEIKKIDQMSEDEVFEEFDSLFGGSES